MISGYITNLGKYNEGELVGEWINFPISDDELQLVLERIGIGSTDDFGQPYEEYFFTDWELPANLDWEIFGETPDIETVNNVAEVLNNTSYSDDVVAAVLDYYSTLEEGLEALERGEFVVYKDVYTTSDLGEAAVDMAGGIENVGEETLRNYFDYEAYGRNLETGSNIVYYDNGAIEFF